MLKVKTGEGYIGYTDVNASLKNHCFAIKKYSFVDRPADEGKEY